ADDLPCEVDQAVPVEQDPSRRLQARPVSDDHFAQPLLDVVTLRLIVNEVPYRHDQRRDGDDLGLAPDIPAKRFIAPKLSFVRAFAIARLRLRRGDLSSSLRRRAWTALASACVPDLQRGHRRES